MTAGRSGPGPSLAAQKSRNGLLFGLLMGLAFALAAWGYDAWALAQAEGVLPWAKFLPGLAGALLLSGAAGWLAARLDNGLLSAVIWLAAGAGLALLTGILPFQFSEALIRWLRPDLAEQVSYPFSDAAQIRTLFTGVATAVAAVIVGVLEMPRVDAAVLASKTTERLMILVLPAPIMLLAGFAAADGLINKPLRTSVVSIHELIEFARENQGQEIDRRVSREMHMGALSALDQTDVYQADYQLLLTGYDEQIWLSQVLVDFGDDQATCTVLGNQPSFCKYEGGQPGSSQAAAPAGTPQPDSLQPTPTDTPAAAETQADSPAAAPQVAASPALEEVLLAPGLEALPDLRSNPGYTIKANIDYAGHSYSGEQVLDVTNMEDVPLDRLYLRLLPNGGASYGGGSLQVSNVRVNDQPVETSLSENDTVLEIPLQEELPINAGVQISLDFQGEVPVDFGGADSSSGYGIFNFTDSVMTLSAWYPMLAVYDEQGWNLDLPSDIGDSVFADTSFYTVTVQTAAEPIIAATGVDVGGLQSADQPGAVSFVSGPVREFFLTLSTDFEVASRTVEGTQINSYYLPGHEAGGLRALEVAADSLSIFNQRFGPYPYSELDVVDSPMRYAAGVEFPGIILIGNFLYNDFESPTFEITVSHEVAHQWWYNVVGNDVFEEPWLDEALTTYSSSLYYEEVFGKSVQNSLIQHWRNRVQSLDEAAQNVAITAPLSYLERQPESGAYGGIVYSKGALFFDALRTEIGDQAFFEALQNYYAANQFEIASRPDLLGAFETAAGRDLSDFYNRWLSGETG